MEPARPEWYAEQGLEWRVGCGRTLEVRFSNAAGWNGTFGCGLHTILAKTNAQWLSDDMGTVGIHLAESNARHLLHQFTLVATGQEHPRLVPMFDLQKPQPVRIQPARH
jgi:hypothetical protein